MTEIAGAVETIGASRNSPWVGTSRDHAFYRAAAITIAAAVFYGFATTYYLKGFFGTPPLPWIIHIHAVIFSSWIVLFVVQTSLVASGRTDLHRRLGIAGVGLAVAMVASGLLAAITVAKLGHFDGALNHDPLESMVINILSLFVFLVLLVAALCYRRKPDLHKRLMLLATTGGLTAAAIGRWPVFAGRPAEAVTVILAFILVGPLYDLITRRRVHPVYIWGVCFWLLLSPPVRVLLARTEIVHDLAGRLIR
jgi:hypothetical protein